MAPLPPPPPPDPATARRGRRRVSPFVVAIVGIVAWLGGLGGALVGNELAERWDRPPSRPSSEPIDVAEPAEVAGRIDVRSVTDFVEPSVVTISADVGGGVGIGSGVMITADGEILTNAHVIAGADDVRVRLSGETEPRSATVLAADRGNDLALLRIEGDGFAAATFADPGSVRLGDEVLAIGAALGLDGGPSVTLGIVSALDRSIGEGDIFLDGLLQTDAAISSGNSGGPLVNAAGQVVGINTAVARDNAIFTATNVGFAISAAEALPIIEELRSSADGDERDEAFLGVGLADRVDGGQGVVVTEVQDGTPAADVGVEVDDLIVAVDGVATTGSSALIAAIRDKRPGDSVEVTIVRGGDALDVDVVLTERPDG